MAISDEAYKELESVLGKENVSRDPGVIETYSYMNGLGSGSTGCWWVRPVCVTLPGNREDIQHVVRTCGKYKLKYKAHSTGWISFAMASSRNCVLLDLRRMNKMEIYPDDFYYITEAYATAGEAQIECMKEGFTPHLVGAGPNASNLASATSMQGTGGTSVRTSMNERNVLGVEWVLPTGEVLRIGSADTPNAGWFSGDGPGPGLRGMMRGSIGNIGGNGVFTKVALKLYPWYGKPYECTGSPPFYNSTDIEFSYYKYAIWDDRDKECDALYRLGEAEILAYSNRWSAAAFLSSVATSNEEYIKLKKEGGFKDVFPKGYWTFFIHASSQKHLDYCVKVFEKILSDTGAKIIDPQKLGQRGYEVGLQNAVRAMWIAKSAYMPTSSNTGVPPLSYETIDHCIKFALDESVAIKRKWIADNRIYDDGEDNAYACLDENAHYLHVEHACHSDNWEMMEENNVMMMEGMKVSYEKGLSPTYMSFPSSMKDSIRYFRYILKIYKMIDPDSVTDSMLSGAMEMAAPLD